MSEKDQRAVQLIKAFQQASKLTSFDDAVQMRRELDDLRVLNYMLFTVLSVLLDGKITLPATLAAIDEFVRKAGEGNTRARLVAAMQADNDAALREKAEAEKRAR